MSISSLKKTDHFSTSPKSRVKDPLKDVAQLYEKQFLRHMVAEMRKTVSESDLLKKNMAEKIFQEKLDHQYVESWGDQGGIGLARLIYDQLQEKWGR